MLMLERHLTTRVHLTRIICRLGERGISCLMDMVLYNCLGNTSQHQTIYVQVVKKKLCVFADITR